MKKIYDPVTNHNYIYSPNGDDDYEACNLDQFDLEIKKIKKENEEKYGLGSKVIFKKIN